MKKFKSSNNASKLKANLDPKNNLKILGGLFQLFFKFKKIKKFCEKNYKSPISKQAQNIKTNIKSINSEREIEAIKANFYLLFPNVNLEIKRISTLKLSNSSKINKFLVKKIEHNYQLNDEILDWGYLGMSLEHRIVALLNNKESRQQIIFGIWMNFPKETGVKKNISEEILRDLIYKNKQFIFQNCLKFLFSSEKINEIDSPSPDESVFLMIIFLSGIPFNFEVKIFPNDLEKPKENEFSNEWLIAKYSHIIEKNNLFCSDNMQINSFKIKNEFELNYAENIDKIRFFTVNAFINKKFKNKDSIVESNTNYNNNGKNLLRNNNKKNITKNLSESITNNQYFPDESNINRNSDLNSKNFLKTDSNDLNFFNPNVNFNAIENNKDNINNNLYKQNFPNNEYYDPELNNKVIVKPIENFKNYRDKLNDLFERENMLNKRLEENSMTNKRQDLYDIEKKNNKNPNCNTNKVYSSIDSKALLQNDILFSPQNKKNHIIEKGENINFNYDYPLKVEKFNRSNSANREISKPKPILHNESNSEMKGSHSAVAHLNNIPPKQQNFNYHKNPDKELTYVDSFSKDFKDSESKLTSYKKDDKKAFNKDINNYNHSNQNINFLNQNEIPPYNQNKISCNNLDESETLSINTNQYSRQDTLKTVSISNRNSFSRDKKSNIEKKGYFEQNNIENYFHESIINYGSKHKKFFSMMEGNKTNNLDKNSIKFQNNHDIIHFNNPAIIQSNQFKLKENNIANKDSEKDQSSKRPSNNLFQINNNYTLIETTLNNIGDPSNNLRNAYTIIYDQANSIQILQDKVTKLQTELEHVAFKLKNQSEEKSLNCSCGNRKSNEKPNLQLISTATNTSFDLAQNFNLENSGFNSNKSANIIMNNQKNTKTHENSKEILSNNKLKTEEDFRYDNLLNDNSINFPKQFLDIDSKQYDSHREDTQNYNMNVNSHHKENSHLNETSKHGINNNDNYDKNNFKNYYNNLNTNLNNKNFNQNYIANNSQSNFISKKNSVNNSNLINSITDMTNQENFNIVSFNNFDNLPVNNQDFPKNINNLNNNNNQLNNGNIYTNEISKKYNDLNAISKNLQNELIQNNGRGKAYTPENYLFSDNTFKTEKTYRYNNNQNIFSTIQSLGEKEENSYLNIPFKPNKFQTIENTSSYHKDQNLIINKESENINDKFGSDKCTANPNKNFYPIINPIIYNCPPEINDNSSLNNFKSNHNINNNYQLTNSFINNLEKLNDSSYIAPHDIDNNINFDTNENYKKEERNNSDNKLKYEIPKTYAVNTNMDITGNDNTSINYDLSHSIDPGTHRLFLKAPSMLGKTNNSISRDENEIGKFNKNKVFDTSALNHNDKTINIPKIFFENNESLESIDENDI